jgi:putative ATPase
VHRFNKSQQDAFLPHVESGLFTFIGATTENPSFEVNSALLSRAAVYVLQPLGRRRPEADRAAGPGHRRGPRHRGGRARPPDRLCRRRCPAAPEHAGDARRRREEGEAAEIDDAWLLKVLGERMRRYDKGGEQFYDTISALHKSMRGSDPDATLYWFVRMLDGGADPRYIARRMIRMAVEDVGLADPRALRIALDAADVYERLGTPEGELALAECLVYLAIAPKSNAVYKAYNEARALVRKEGTRPVPMHLRNAPTS